MDRTVLTMDGRGRFGVSREPAPKMADFEVTVEVMASLISPGTHLGNVRQDRAEGNNDRPPRPFGYQVAGIVRKRGRQVTSLEEGDRVACIGSGAKHTDLAVVAQNLCVRLPEAVSFEEGAFVNLACTALQAVRRAEIEFGENILVAGLGIVGNLAGQVSALCGGHVLGLDHLENRRAAARETGFEEALAPAPGWTDECARFAAGYGFDCAFICFGGDASELFRELLKVMKVSPDTHVMGRVVIPGGCAINTRFGAVTGNLDLRSSARTGPGYHDPAWERGGEYPKVFVPWTFRRNAGEIFRAVAAGKINLRRLVTHTLPLEKGPEACELLVESPGEALGVILKP